MLKLTFIYKCILRQSPFIFEMVSDSLSLVFSYILTLCIHSVKQRVGTVACSGVTQGSTFSGFKQLTF